MSEASKRTQDWIQENFQEMWDKKIWPLSSPDYSLLDYFVCVAFLSYRSVQSLTTKSRT
jgi:hypothetical protein